jgi:hypothetical protein
MKKTAVKYKPGGGISVPPKLDHVIIYFVQKDRSEQEASAFYIGMLARKWKNAKGMKIKNWKQHAWAWILNNHI